MSEAALLMETDPGFANFVEHYRKWKAEKRPDAVNEFELELLLKHYRHDKS